MGPAAALTPNHAPCCCAGAHGYCSLPLGHILQSWGMLPVPAASSLDAQQGTCSAAGASGILGLECAGIVEDVGEGVTRIRKGDRVCALLDGGGEEGRAGQPLVLTGHAGLPRDRGAFHVAHWSIQSGAWS